jgi:hypothetical protein
MKYSIEIENGIANETLVFNGKEYKRATKKTGFHSTSDDKEFGEQMENEISTDVSYKIYEIYDTLNSFFTDILLDIAEYEEHKVVGKWIKTGGSFRCSECMGMPEFTDIRTLKKCPKCGAEMRGEEDD